MVSVQLTKSINLSCRCFLSVHNFCINFVATLLHKFHPSFLFHPPCFFHSRMVCGPIFLASQPITRAPPRPAYNIQFCLLLSVGPASGVRCFLCFCFLFSLFLSLLSPFFRWLLSVSPLSLPSGRRIISPGDLAGPRRPAHWLFWCPTRGFPFVCWFWSPTYHFSALCFAASCLSSGYRLAHLLIVLLMVAEPCCQR